MRFAVLQFPGSNCDQDLVWAMNTFPGVDARLVWHQETDLSSYDAFGLPGGFSYGDYLRCGAIARFSPVLQALKTEADKGKPVVGICNGFQILCEAGLLPGALLRNRDLLFICEQTNLRVETSDTAFTRLTEPGQVLRIPIAHGEGCYFADEPTLDALERNGQVLLRYCDAGGALTPESNPNGSARNIAGIRNEAGNVFGLMPHPERAAEARLGSADGRLLLGALASFL